MDQAGVLAVALLLRYAHELDAISQRIVLEVCQRPPSRGLSKDRISHPPPRSVTPWR